jgi:hypothetical protein
MVPVLPEKTAIHAVMVITTVAAIRRTPAPLEGTFREKPFISGPFSPGKIPPGPAERLTCHVYPFRILEYRNQTHLIRN